MSGFNLITRRWIPVSRADGTRIEIRPSEMTMDDLFRPAWPRGDMDIACLELLIGLVAIAAPPADRAAWLAGFDTPPDLEEAFERLIPAFELFGDGPRFLQDLDAEAFAEKEGSLRAECAKVIDKGAEPRNRLDFLFIDSAGQKTAGENKDVLVHRDLYFSRGSQPPAFMAMALFTLQSQSPSGGAGNRVSMRGGGPLITLVDPGTGRLWDLIWANVPYGHAIAELTELPWMRPTEVSNDEEVAARNLLAKKAAKTAGKKAVDEEKTVPVKNAARGPGEGFEAEVFFGMPRRLRMVGNDNGITAVLQLPYGTNYGSWTHPLTPYYLAKEGRLPVRAQTVTFGYANWLGPILGNEHRFPAHVVDRWKQDRGREPFSMIIGGWMMNNMAADGFLVSQQQIREGDLDREDDIIDMIEAAQIVLRSTCAAIRKSLDLTATGEENEKTSARSLGSVTAISGNGAAGAARDIFYRRTEIPFRAVVRKLSTEGRDAAALSWHGTLVRTAMAIFTEMVEPELPTMPLSRRAIAARQRNILQSVLKGDKAAKASKALFDALNIPLPDDKAASASAKKEAVNA